MTREVAKCTLDAVGAEEARWHKEAPNGQGVIISYIHISPVLYKLHWQSWASLLFYK